MGSHKKSNDGGIGKMKDIMYLIKEQARTQTMNHLWDQVDRQIWNLANNIPNNQIWIQITSQECKQIIIDEGIE